MLILDYLSNEDTGKARKAVIYVSAFTLIFAAFNITSNELKILNFSFEISQKKVVKLGQISTVVLLVSFLLRSLPDFIEQAKKSGVERLSRKGDRETVAFQHYIMNEREGEEHYQHGPESEYNDFLEDLKKKRETYEERADKLKTGIQFLVGVVLDILFPVVLAVIVVENPYYLSDMVNIPSDNIFDHIFPHMP